MELDGSILSLGHEIFGYRLMRKETGTSEPHSRVGTFFMSFYWGLIIASEMLNKVDFKPNSARGIRSVWRQRYRIPVGHRNTFLALVTGLNLHQVKAGERKSSKNHKNKDGMGIYEGFNL